MSAPLANPRMPLALFGYGYINRDDPVTQLDELTPRHRETAMLAADGHTNTAIAKQLGIKPQSVKAQLLMLYDVLEIPRIADGVQPRVLLARWVWEQSQ